MDQVIGIIATIISTGVFLDKNGIPEPGMALGYFLFGLLFVTLGLFIGKMIDTTLLSLLLLQEWNVNISLMVIGYCTIIAALAGWAVAIRALVRERQESAD